ncbi:MAG: class II glutamine amidotransferase [Alphaproteobacteria bacterium]
MCELFAMSSRQPSAVTYSLREFAANGSGLRSNRSGWGIAYAHDRDAFTIKEPLSAAGSPWVDFVAENSVKSKCVIAHVRHATRGSHTLENTHPFRRVLGRQVQLFAHNGTLEGIERACDADALVYTPVGETDSELAFCLLLDRLRPLWRENGGAAPPLAVRMEMFVAFCREMGRLGSANFLYFDGDALFAHAHRRVHEVAGQVTPPEPPGLRLKDWSRDQVDRDYTAPGLTVDVHDRQTVMLASVPLDEDGWESLPEGTALAIRDGTELERCTTL